MATRANIRRRVKGEPWVWLCGGAVATGIVMIVGMLLLISFEGTTSFWPHDVEAFVMGKARYHVHHPELGPVFVADDDSRIVVPAAGNAWRLTNGKVYLPDPEADAPGVASMATFRAGRQLFAGGAFRTGREIFAGGDWVVRGPDGKLLLDEHGIAVSPAALDENAFDVLGAQELPEYEANPGAWLVEDARRGKLFVAPEGKLVYTVDWRGLDKEPVPLDFESPRKATIADYRQLPELFADVEWILTDSDDNRVLDEEGNPVTAADYLANPDRYPSPWGALDEQGRHVPIETLLGDDTWRDHTLLVGTVRSERPMDIRILPPNPDGTPVKPYQLDESPSELLVRQGNQGEGLYNDSAYFRWVRVDVPEPEAMKRHRLSSYEEVVIERAPLPGAVLIERLEKGVLAGYVVSVSADGELKASIERDGQQATWEAFLEQQERMRALYLERYRVEKHDLGRVNFELKDRTDALKRIRYEHRDSRNFVAAMDRLDKVHEDWAVQEPQPDAKADAQGHLEKLLAWLEQLQPLLEAWNEDSRALDLTADELSALERAAALEAQRAEIQARQFGVLRHKVVQMRDQEAHATYDFRTADGKQATLLLAEVVRAHRPNEMGVFGKSGVYLSRVWEYLTDDPRESNTEGGIWPVILGTLVMTLLMCVAVVPFGVIAALYLREYAKQGPIVSAVRIAVNNLAGVPSIVFGIFGLGFFCVVMGGSIDDLFFPELQPAPVFGGGGIMWASLTLALLTVPVVIVSTEEALSAVGSSQREASLACGASKFQTIWKVVLPQALPGVLTGTILAMARGAGEVAPLMLVGAVKYALFPPIDAIPPLVHLERKFMHLGFHVYDVGFQSPNVDNTKPLVFATSLVLIVLVAVLNIFAIRLRNKLRKKYATSAV